MRCTLPDSESEMQIWYFRNKERGQADVRDESFGRGVLIAPQRPRNEPQKIMVLLGLIRSNPGLSEKPLTRNDFGWLKSKGAIQETDRKPYFATRVVFPNFSRAAGILCGRSSNGWEGWELFEPPVTLSDAYRLDADGKFALKFYDLPDDVIEVPSAYH